MIQLIVNADDFGFSSGVNYGIIDTHLNGIVNSATMMMNMEGTEHAIQLAKEHPSLQVGIHLVLTCGKPLLHDVSSLTNEEGSFHSLSDLHSKKGTVLLEEVEREWTAQIEKFLRSGVPLTHTDSHHHVHTIEELLPVVQRLSKKYNLPVRTNGLERIKGVEPFSDLALFDFYGDGVEGEYFTKLKERFPEHTKIEVMTHPAYLDNALLKGSSYTYKRLEEVEILKTVVLPREIQLL
ncbi:chitin disaccharide deacetylase [Robertmurraya korlensis]|uniref:chitin disaccharide deacetylase n=1 Tax=Robertmurraya korlensis TaxID=519977 RepID=UPI000825B836|nr:chitin disaccharide deacetylase [Robertmurraya korlensis]